MLEISLELSVVYSVLQIFDIISRSAMVGFSLLRARYYYNSKGRACYVLLLYDLCSYGELSILLFFILSLDTPSEIHFLLLYFNLQQICYFIKLCL